MQVDDLHDAVLENVCVHAEEGRVAFEITPIQFNKASERVVIVARQFEHFIFPRKQPWGLVKVWYVNEVRGPFSLGSKLQRLQVEMQSGDVIEIHATSFERIDQRTEDFRSTMEEQWISFVKDAERSRDPNLRGPMWSGWYSGLSNDDRTLANRILAEWVHSPDSGRQFDALGQRCRRSRDWPTISARRQVQSHIF
jgi:hypothetical protein